MTRRAVIGVVLLLALLVGVAYQPDVGTAADLHSAALTDFLVGANHAKPLPRIVTVAEVFQTSSGLLLTLVLLALCLGLLRVGIDDDGRHRSVHRSLVRARRGPPALSLG